MRGQAFPERRSFVVPLTWHHIFESEGLLVEHGWPPGSLIFPGRNESKEFIVSPGIAIWGLTLLAEVSATGFRSLIGILDDEFCKLQEVCHAARMLELLVQPVCMTSQAQVFPEARSKRTHLLLRARKSGPITRHSAVVPHDLAQLSMEAVGAACPLGRDKTSRPRAHFLLTIEKLSCLGRDRAQHSSGKMPANRIWRDKKAVRKALHQCAGS